VGPDENVVRFLHAAGHQLILACGSITFLQRILNHARQDTNGTKSSNQSLDWIGRVSEINVRRFEQFVQLSVVVNAKRDRNPRQMLPSANMMMLNVSSATTDGATSIAFSSSLTAIVLLIRDSLTMRSSSRNVSRCGLRFGAHKPPPTE
jgi:hypothetical protein